MALNVLGHRGDRDPSDIKFHLHPQLPFPWSSKCLRGKLSDFVNAFKDDFLHALAHLDLSTIQKRALFYEDGQRTSRLCFNPLVGAHAEGGALLTK